MLLASTLDLSLSPFDRISSQFPWGSLAARAVGHHDDYFEFVEVPVLRSAASARTRHCQCVQTDHNTDGNHRQTEPAGRNHLLFGARRDLHEQCVQRRCVVGRDRPILAQLDQRSRGRFIQHERVDHAKLDSQEDQQHAGHEVAVASEFHRSITISRANGGVEDKSFRWLSGGSSAMSACDPSHQRDPRTDLFKRSLAAVTAKVLPWYRLQTCFARETGAMIGSNV